MKQVNRFQNNTHEPVYFENIFQTTLNYPEVKFKIVCSTGTYIRSLANDLGAALGCGGYLSELCRTRIGEFELKDAWTMEESEQKINEALHQNGQPIPS